MNVVPFPPRAEQQSPPSPGRLAFTIGARIDLRIGALAAGVVRPLDATAETFGFSNLARLLRSARMTWRERGAHAPLTLALPSEICADLDGELLGEAAIEAGCTRQKLAFELCERAIARTGTGLAEELRARGYSVVLRGDPDCPIPLGERARSLYSELVIDAPEHPGPFFALDRREPSPLGRRLVAARAAGITTTAHAVRDAAHARVLAIAGFDRGGGRFAEAGLR